MTLVVEGVDGLELPTGEDKGRAIGDGVSGTFLGGGGGGISVVDVFFFL